MISSRIFLFFALAIDTPSQVAHIISTWGFTDYISSSGIELDSKWIIIMVYAL